MSIELLWSENVHISGRIGDREKFVPGTRAGTTGGLCVDIPQYATQLPVAQAVKRGKDKPTACPG